MLVIAVGHKRFPLVEGIRQPVQRVIAVAVASQRVVAPAAPVGLCLLFNLSNKHLKILLSILNHF